MPNPYLYSTAELEALPTICTGQAADLKIDTEGVRYWLHRTGLADGEPYENTVSVEVIQNGSWTTVIVYDGDEE